MSDSPQTVYEHRPQRVYEGLRWNGSEWVMGGDIYDNDDWLQAEWDWFDRYQELVAKLNKRKLKTN